MNLEAFEHNDLEELNKLVESTKRSIEDCTRALIIQKGNYSLAKAYLDTPLFNDDPFVEFKSLL